MMERLLRLTGRDDKADEFLREIEQAKQEAENNVGEDEKIARMGGVVK